MKESHNMRWCWNINIGVTFTAQTAQSKLAPIGCIMKKDTEARYNLINRNLTKKPSSNKLYRQVKKDPGRSVDVVYVTDTTNSLAYFPHFIFIHIFPWRSTSMLLNHKLHIFDRLDMIYERYNNLARRTHHNKE